MANDVQALEAKALGKAPAEYEEEYAWAYATLGEMGTSAARQAVARIEEAARKSEIDLQKELFDRFTGRASPLANALAPDGTEYMVVPHDCSIPRRFV